MIDKQQKNYDYEVYHQSSKANIILIPDGIFSLSAK